MSPLPHARTSPNRGVSGRRAAAAFGWAVSAFPPASAAQDRPVAITNVTVIPGTGAPAAAGQTVVIQGGRIRLVGATHASPPPTDRAADSTTQVIDGTGRYLIPGLWDLHAHLVHTSRVAGVMLGGRWMDRRELDRLLAQSRAWGR